MTPKTAYYAAMAEDAAQQITGSREQWTAFLTTAGRLYKYPYHEQLLIFAQRPDAVACAGYDLWNERMHRYVKRGSKGIALLDNTGDQPKIRYVFDVSDTGTRKSSRPVVLWQMADEHRQPVQEALEKTYGISAAENSFEDQIESIARNLAGEYWEEHEKQIIDIIADSYLEEYDEFNIGASFRNAATTSISYMIFSRCMDRPDDYFEHEDFLDIFDFNTRATTNALGTAVSEISAQIFREIERTIRTYDRTKEAERSNNHDERADLHPQRGLSDPGRAADPHRAEASGQVRSDASGLPEGAQSDPVQRPDSNREAVPAPARDRRDGAPESRADDAAAAEAGPRTRQGDESDGLGAAHEQPEGTGRGSRNDGAYQQLTFTGLFPSENEQISMIEEAESLMPSAFSFTQDEIDHVLQLGINEDNGRKIVALEYMKQKSLEQLIPTLQTVYHGGCGMKDDSRNISVWYNEEGIRMSVGNSAEHNTSAQLIPWADAAQRISELLDTGRYATNVELAEALGHERQQLAQSLWYLYHDLSEDAVKQNILPILGGIRGGGFPDETERLAKNLRDSGFVAQLKNEYQQFLDAHDGNHSLLRFHYHKLNRIAQRLDELNTPLREYHTDMMQPPLMRQFITDDEIDHALGGGSGVANGKERIYQFWQEGHSKHEKADFLKEEYGTGGRSHALSGSSGSSENHDAKGERFTKKGCDKVQLSWAQVAARLDNLIRDGRYIDQELIRPEEAVEAEEPQKEDGYKIFYAGAGGQDQEAFIKAAKDETYYGVPITVVLYKDDEGKTIPTDFIYDLDPPPKGLYIEDTLGLMKDEPETFVDQVMADAERIADEQEPPYERFSIVPVEDGGYVVWDDLHDGVYTDENGVGQQFVTEQEAQAALAEAQEKADAQTAADWLAVEQAKVETQPEKGISDADVRSLFSKTPYLKAELGEIATFFMQNPEPEVRMAYLQENFNYEFSEVILDAKRRFGYKTHNDHLEVWEGNYLTADAKRNLSWSDVEAQFAVLAQQTQEQKLSHEEVWNCKIGDTVYLENNPYEITDITERHVELLPPGQIYPIYRSESKENFERLLADDPRNFDFRNFAAISEDEMNHDVLTMLTERCDLFSQQERQDIVNMIESGATNQQVADKFRDTLLGRSGRMNNSYGTELKFEAQEDHLVVELHDVSSAFYELSWKEVAAVLRTVKDEFLHAADMPVEQAQKEVEHFIDHFYVVEDLQAQGPLVLKEYGAFDDALRDYQNLPSDKVKALGAAKVPSPLPGSLDLMQCIDGHDKVVQDYTQVPGWQNPEIQTVVDQLTAAIETKEIPEIPAVNFHITDEHLGEGGPKAKFIDNIRAIQLLKQLEHDGRNAAPDEQEVLSRYVGWGGLADAFDPNKPAWASEYAELKATLTTDEYEAARASTLNAHYTSPVVIQAMYDAIEKLGFESGNVLEPAMGVGNFFGMMPDSMRNSNLYGVELDSISGRIAQKLYPNADIKVAGFETTDRRDFFDLAVGNVPFGNYKVADKPYDKLGFSIHNYFFAKTMDQIRPGGVVAFVTSRYTMDSKNSDARRYLAQRADLLGAIRLPNDAFKRNTGADVVSDILFLQKREQPIDIEPDWVHLNTTPDGFTMNSYFVDNPEMIMGELAMESTPYGKDDLTVRPREDVILSAQLDDAIEHIHGSYQAAEQSLEDGVEMQDTVPATPDVKNFSFAVVDGEIYFRENSIMRHVALNDKAKERIQGMVELREIVNDLIEYQLEDYPDEQIRQKQAQLNDAYDAFSKKYGLINDRANERVFADDSSYFLLCSLENVDEDGKLKSKADMFTKRTIKPEHHITSVDTPSEALAVSIGEHGKVDLPYMAELLGTPEQYDVIISELNGVIFKNPMAPDDPTMGWEMADEYLSGDVRSKLHVARMAAENDSAFAVNVQALEKSQPKDLDASEIDVRLGATWIDPEYIQQFMHEVLETPFYLRRSIEVKYAELTAEWRITGKSSISYNDVAAYTTFGTERANAYHILEDTLNLKDARVYDTIEDADGKQKRVLNKKQTTLAQQKQQAIKDAFRDWIWKDPQRREVLVKKYNILFNSTKPREYDGSHITFGGMNPDIHLREHQSNAVAHILYGGNTLLAHEVGAGKTFEITAAAMESKRLGLCQKSLIVVPNHLTTQWANEFLQLYPSAKILVATRKDFDTKNRKKFCARIATGDYDAVIIGHSQFEKIPLSAERQERQLREQIDEIEDAIAEMKWQRGENFSIKQMEKTRKSLQARLDKLQAADRKDDVVTFEQLGVDRLFVDESHAFKNLFLYTKMRNVAGLSTSEAQKSSDMFMKCRYMDELTGGRGVVFATGTPVSNSMTELYTVMRYLQYSTLQQKKLTHFDAWASTFGETSTAIELAPEGTGYRARTRFAKFFNLPELMNMFKEVADIKTSDQLHLPVPEAKFETVVVQPSENQKEMVAELSERAAAVHSGVIDPSEDNMLKITSDGRKLGLDQRLMNPLLPDDPESKLNACVRNVTRIYDEGTPEKLTQLLFCDLSTPKKDGTFNVYDDIRTKLLAHGIPAEEIAFIHDADTEQKKKDLFSKVRSGQVRVLLGSTQKMGAGTNVQDRLVAVHHLDVGWRPSDMTQRNGRIIRQGNRNQQVQVYQYVTEGTFDAYLYQTLENKQKFISQIMTSKSPVRSCDDVDEQALSYAEIKALCAGNPLIKEKMDLDIDVARLKVLKADHQSQQYRMEDKLLKYFPAEIERQTGFIKGYETDAATAAVHPQMVEGFCGMEILGKSYVEKADAGEIILAACKEMKGTEPTPLGSYRGFQMELSFDSFRHEFDIVMKGALSHRVSLGTDARGNITRLDNALAGIPDRLAGAREQLENLHKQQDATKLELGKPFPQEAELAEKSARLAELDTALNMDGGAETPEDREPDERPSVLADLKSKAQKVQLFKSYDYHEEVL